MSKYDFSEGQASQILGKLVAAEPTLAAEIRDIVREIAPDYDPQGAGWELVEDAGFRFLEVPASNMTVMEAAGWSVSVRGNVYM